jgi:ADP-heptose:LPS heptosyltransferase
MILRGRPPVGAPRRILVIQLRRIGDTLLGTPALRALAKSFPEAKIDFIAEDPAWEALQGNPHIDRLLIPARHGWKNTLRFLRELRRERYDWAIDFLSNPRSAQFAMASGAKFRLGLDRFGRRWAYTHRGIEEPADQVAYAVDLRLQMLALIGVPAHGRELEVYADHANPHEVERVSALLNLLPADKPVVAIGCGGWIAAKRYPAALTVHLAALMAEQGLQPILTIGPGEHEFAQILRAQLPPTIPLLNEARVSTLAALYRRSALYIGPDSAPKHIAVACGIPSLTLFGPGAPSNWNDPQNSHNIVLMPECNVRPACIESACAQRHCLEKLSPQVIADVAAKLLTDSKRP